MIGLCCQYIVPNITKTKTTFVNMTNERTLQYNNFKNGKYDKNLPKQIWLNNLDGVYGILKQLVGLNIKLFRFSSNLLPLFDLLPELHNDTDILDKLLDIGCFVKQHGIRLTTHPDQFVVLSSNSDNVIQNSVSILNYHAWIFDKMGLEKSQYYTINIHGGTKGNHKTLIKSIKSLPDSVSSRLSLENDERSYNVLELNDVYSETGVPICFDSHHHSFNDGGLTIDSAMQIAMATWKEKPLTHLSNTSPGMENASFTEKRKHSDYVHYIPEIQKQLNNDGKIDIEFEFKMKNIAIFKAVDQFGLLLS